MEFFDFGFESVALELLQDVFGRAAVGGTAGHVRLGGQGFVMGFSAGGVGHGQELFF